MGWSHINEREREIPSPNGYCIKASSYSLSVRLVDDTKWSILLSQATCMGKRAGVGTVTKNAELWLKKTHFASHLVSKSSDGLRASHALSHPTPTYLLDNAVVTKAR